ncbi:unnamed protein product [Paramecium sonneborni]|uniref:Uncharacterized protein n=1 Tax=Paramecium sonneborni TaxID=65129 RepID=A0A8S1QXV9_9CILI|nr:unnamed protein product [Paramecium sonneborni]
MMIIQLQFRFKDQQVSFLQDFLQIELRSKRFLIIKELSQEFHILNVGYQIMLQQKNINIIQKMNQVIKQQNKQIQLALFLQLMLNSYKEKRNTASQYLKHYWQKKNSEGIKTNEDQFQEYKAKRGLVEFKKSYQKIKLFQEVECIIY